MKTMISIVCVYNDEKILTDYLLKSLEDQTAEFELLKIDNTQSIYKSTAEALNYGSKKARGKYIMFIHQDVDLSSNSWLEDAEKILDSIPDLGIAGVAGMTEEGNTYKGRRKNIIKDGVPPKWTIISTPIQKPEKVQTLDECLIIIPKSVFNILQFDEDTCDGWHLYAVDYCLSIKRHGFSAYVLQMCIYHRSAAYSFSKEYYLILKKVIKKHKFYFRRIYTTCGEWNTYYPLILQRSMLAIKSLLLPILIKLGFGYLWKKLGLKYLVHTLRR